MKIGDNSNLFSRAKRTGVVFVLDFNILNVSAPVPAPPPAPAPPLPAVRLKATVPLFASSLLLAGYSASLRKLQEFNGVTGIPVWIASATNNVYATAAINQLIQTNFIYTDGTLNWNVLISCNQINYYDILSMLAAGDLLKITNIRFQIPSQIRLQTKQNMYFFDQDISGKIEVNTVNLADYFDPSNKTGTTNDYIVLDVPVNYFVSDKFGIAIDVLGVPLISEISSLNNIRVSFIVEKYFNSSFVNSKNLS